MKNQHRTNYHFPSPSGRKKDCMFQKCVEIEIASCGNPQKESRENIREAIEFTWKMHWNTGCWQISNPPSQHMKNSLPLIEVPSWNFQEYHPGTWFHRWKRGGLHQALHQGKRSHTALICTNDTGQKLLVIIPKRDILPIGTLLSIMKQGKFTREEFTKILTGWSRELKHPRSFCRLMQKYPTNGLDGIFSLMKSQKYRHSMKTNKAQSPLE